MAHAIAFYPGSLLSGRSAGAQESWPRTLVLLLLAEGFESKAALRFLEESAIANDAGDGGKRKALMRGL